MFIEIAPPTAEKISTRGISRGIGGQGHGRTEVWDVLRVAKFSKVSVPLQGEFGALALPVEPESDLSHRDQS